PDPTIPTVASPRPRSTLFPYTTLFRSQMINDAAKSILVITQDSDAPQSDRACYIGTDNRAAGRQAGELVRASLPQGGKIMVFVGDRKSTRLNSSHRTISYAVFCLKKKK